MKIQEICEYLNEFGILSIKNTPLFLSIYSGLISSNKEFKNNLNKNIDSENNKLKIILFAYLKKILSNDKELYELCSNIINSHSKNKIIKQYQGICFLNKVIFYQIKNRFNHFLFLLFKRKYPKRKYFPYNPLYAAKSTSKLDYIKPNISFTNTNTRRKNNFLNLNEENSLSYFSNKNNNKHYNKIIFNTNSDELNKSENMQTKHSFAHPVIPIPDLVEKMNRRKKEISMNNMKKKLYDAQIRINNYENIMPISRRNRQKEMKSREEEEYFNKLKEDKIYQKLTEKEIDKNNILDRLYRKEIIKKQELKMKEKENKKRDKSPIDWDKVNSLNSKKNYLNININSQDINSIKEIIKNNPKKNINSSREMFSFGIPNDNEKIKLNQNNIRDNKNKIDYNDFIKNKKDIIGLNKNEKEIEENNNVKNNNINGFNKFVNNLNNNNYLNLKQLDENEIEKNLNRNEVDEYEININKKEENNNLQQTEKYTFGEVSNQRFENKLSNKGDNNIEENEIETIPQKENNNIEETENEKEYNFTQGFIPKNDMEEYQGNEDEQKEEEEIIYDNNAFPNEQNDYQYENNNKEDGEEEYDNEEYDLENEEIENDMNKNMEKELNINNINENGKIGNENINYEDFLGENIEEYLDEEEKDK